MEPTSPRTAIWRNHLPWILVLAVAVALAARTFVHFRTHSRHLWTDGVHDRNAHYCFALNLALDLLHGDFKELRHDLNGARVWGPLHGILLSCVLLIGDLNYQFAVLPSLLGWVGTALLAFLLARRITPHYGNWAGLVAATLVVASPAHRAFSADVMLESLGACLTLLALYLYLVSVQDQSKWAARALAVTMTALFLHKYNYWLLVLLAFLVNETIRRRTEARSAWGRWIGQFDWRHRARCELRNPLNYLIAALLGVTLWIVLTGGSVFSIGSTRVSVKTPHNVLHAAYLLVFLRLLLWWRRGGGAQVGKLPLQERQLIFWHGWPIAIWFLLPKRLGYFIWFLGPSNKGENASSDFLAGATAYWRHAITDYHLGLWSALLALGLTVLVLVAHRRLRPGSTVVIWLLLISCALTINHPNQKSRFLHSWIAATWVLAGVGVAQFALARLGRLQTASLRPWLIGTAAVMLIAAHVPGALEPGRAPEAGVKPERATILEVSDHYLPDLEGSKRVAILCNVPLKFFSEWTYLDRYGGRRRVVTDLKGYDPNRSSDANAVHDWLAGARQDTIVLLDVPKDSRFYVEVNLTDYQPLHRQLKQQRVFVLDRRIELRQHGCSIEVWKRHPLAASKRGMASRRER